MLCCLLLLIRYCFANNMVLSKDARNRLPSGKSGCYRTLNLMKNNCNLEHAFVQFFRRKKQLLKSIVKYDIINNVFLNLILLGK